jgi:hypothetical protein
VASLGRATLKVISGGDGTFRFSGISQGVATIMATLPGFNTAAANFVVGNIGTRVDIQMKIGSLEETITVTASTPRVDPWDPHTAIEASHPRRTSSTFSVAWRECCRSASTCRAPGRRTIFRERRSLTKTRTCHFTTVAGKRMSYERLGMNLMLGSASGPFNDVDADSVALWRQ